MGMPQQFYYKKNRLQQIRGFCYVVQTGSMLKCARKMGLTQGAITLQIQSLERDLGIKLFDRSGKEIKLTKSGEMFYDHAISSLQKMDSLFESFASINSKKSLTQLVLVAILSSSTSCQNVSNNLKHYIRKLSLKLKI